MQTFLRSAFATLAGLLLMSKAVAQNPNIDCAAVTVSQSGNTFTISGKVAGLGNGNSVTVAVTGNIQGEAFCENKQGKRTSAGSPAQGTGSGSATYTAGRNGSVSFSVKISSAAVDAALASTGSCPTGQKKILVYTLLSYAISATAKDSAGNTIKVVTCP